MLAIPNGWTRSANHPQQGGESPPQRTTKMTLVQFAEFVNNIYTLRPLELREGQWAFICLYSLDAEFAGKITATENDPFYDDKKIKKFLQVVLENVIE
jgi:hypothetical protein